MDAEAGKVTQVSAGNDCVKGSIHLNKIDRETTRFLPQGDSVLAGAVYGLYAREDIVHPDGRTGVLHRSGSLITQGTVGKDGTLYRPVSWKNVCQRDHGAGRLSAGYHAV